MMKQILKYCSESMLAARRLSGPPNVVSVSRPRRWLCRLFTPVFASVLLASAEPMLAGELSAGVAREDITPAPGLKNFAQKNEPYNGVLTPINVRALVVSDGVQKIALIQWDLVYARSGAVAKVRQLVSAETGIPPRNILVNASHTHAGPDSPIIGERLIKEDIESELPAQEDPKYQLWAVKLFTACVQAVKAANTSLQPVTLEIGRAIVPEWLHNRRPRKPDGKVDSSLMWPKEDPYTMPDGLRFGPTDPTLTVLTFRNLQHQPVVTLFNYPCHAVSVYVETKAISADWPGYAADQIEARLGGCAIFLQGCAGDLVPARRGIEAARQMGALIGERAAHAASRPLRIDVDRLQVNSAEIGLPLTIEKRAELGRDLKLSEVQVFVLGSVAIVALPGEPLIELAKAIQQQSPYPHTIVLGYSNDTGVYYVGMPGEKARGGYEVNQFSGLGTDECGTILVETALRLLREVAAR